MRSCFKVKSVNGLVVAPTGKYFPLRVSEFSKETKGCSKTVREEMKDSEDIAPSMFL